MPPTRREVVQTASLGAMLASLLKATPAVSAPAAGQGTKIVNLDDRVTFEQQLDHNVGPVVLMSTFLVPPDQVDNFLEGFNRRFAIMRKQPGLISAQLHRHRGQHSPWLDPKRLQSRLATAYGVDRSGRRPTSQRRLSPLGIQSVVDVLHGKSG
jgi:hypothetical protein